MADVQLRPADEHNRRLWLSVAELAALLPPDWVLIGGLMVQLHALESGIEDVRVTIDVDVLGQARPPGALPAIEAALQRGGFELVAPADGLARRYTRGQLIVDVLAPDGLRAPSTRSSRLVDDPRKMSAELKPSERRWLRDAAERLDLDRPASLTADRVRLARLALRLLLREP